MGLVCSSNAAISITTRGSEIVEETTDEALDEND